VRQFCHAEDRDWRNRNNCSLHAPPPPPPPLGMVRGALWGPNGHLFTFLPCLHGLFPLQEMPLRCWMLTASVLASFKCQLHHKLDSFWKREAQLRKCPHQAGP
jgi:hypothetical protein